MGISQYRLAKDISVPPRRINEIVQGKRAVTADTALRLYRYTRKELGGSVAWSSAGQPRCGIARRDVSCARQGFSHDPANSPV